MAVPSGRRLSPAVLMTGWPRSVNLTRELAWTQFKLKYTGSALGYLWSLVKPLLTFAIMYAIFGYGFNLRSQSPNFPVQLLVGIVVWTFFAETTGAAMSAVASNGNLIRKAHFPRSILVISSSLTSLATMGINLVLIVVIAAPLGSLSLGLRSLLAPLFIVELYVLVMGVSLLLSSLFVFFRDLGHIWEVVSLVLFYASAVVYPLSFAHGATIQRLILLNPVAQIIEDLRHSLVSSGVPWSLQITGGGWYLLPLGSVLAAAWLGVAVFRHFEPRFAEEL